MASMQTNRWARKTTDVQATKQRVAETGVDTTIQTAQNQIICKNRQIENRNNHTPKQAHKQSCKHIKSVRYAIKSYHTSSSIQMKKKDASKYPYVKNKACKQPDN